MKAIDPRQQTTATAPFTNRVLAVRLVGMAGYSMELRERVVAAVDKGLGKAVVAETFGVSVRTINR